MLGSMAQTSHTFFKIFKGLFAEFTCPRLYNRGKQKQASSNIFPSIDP